MMDYGFIKRNTQRRTITYCKFRPILPNHPCRSSQNLSSALNFNLFLTTSQSSCWDCIEAHQHASDPRFSLSTMIVNFWWEAENSKSFSLLSISSFQFLPQNFLPLNGNFLVRAAGNGPPSPVRSQSASTCGSHETPGASLADAENSA